MMGLGGTPLVGFVDASSVDLAVQFALDLKRRDKNRIRINELFI